MRIRARYWRGNTGSPPARGSSLSRRQSAGRFLDGRPNAVSWAATVRGEAGGAGSGAFGQQVGNRCGSRRGAQVVVHLDRGAETEIVFLLGQAETIEDVRGIVERYQTTRKSGRSTGYGEAVVG